MIIIKEIKIYEAIKYFKIVVFKCPTFVRLILISCVLKPNVLMYELKENKLCLLVISWFCVIFSLLLTTIPTPITLTLIPLKI